MKLKSSKEWDWEQIKNLPVPLMADTIGLRLLNTIDMAARRPTNQTEIFSLVGRVDPGTFTLLDLMRAEDAVHTLECRIQDSKISLELGRWSLITNAGKKNQRRRVALKVRASCGADLPLSEANLRPVRREYRRLVKARPEKV